MAGVKQPKKAKPLGASDAKNPNCLRVDQHSPAETLPESMAHAVLRPTVQAAFTMQTFNKWFGEIDVNQLIADLSAQCQQASAGDLGRPEAILTAQAHTLDSIFNNLAKRAAANAGEGYLDAADTYLRLALKAQSQCRATLETLAEIKNPRPVAFVRQANIANGPQQVNNGSPRAGEQENKPTKLLEQSNGKRLDGSTPATAGLTHSPLETLDALHGAEVAAGQGARVHECVQGRNAEDAADTREGAQVPK